MAALAGPNGDRQGQQQQQQQQNETEQKALLILDSSPSHIPPSG